WLPPLAKHALDLFHVLVAYALAAAIAALDALEHVLPHVSCWLERAPAHVAPLQPIGELPFARELGRAEVSPLAAVRVGVLPLDFNAHGGATSPETPPDRAATA